MTRPNPTFAPSGDPDMLSVSDVARLTGYSRWTIVRAIRAGHLRGVRPPGRRKFVIPAADLRAWLGRGELFGAVHPVDRVGAHSDEQGRTSADSYDERGR